MIRFVPRRAPWAIALAALGSLSACVTPTATQNSQRAILQKGDHFTLLNPASNGSALRGFDAQLQQKLSTLFGTAVSGGRSWLVEYSYAIRPAAVAMRSDGQDFTLEQPKSDAILRCTDTSHRMTIRIVSADNGSESYRGTAEVVDCRDALDPDDAVAGQLLDAALRNLVIE